MTSQRNMKQKDLDDPNNSQTCASKIQLNEQIQNLNFDLNEIKKEINNKYNKNIIAELKKLELEQETKVLKFINALGRSQYKIHTI